MVETKCAICGIDDSIVIYKANFDPSKINEFIFSARRLPDKIHYQIVKCKRCGLVYSNPILPLNKIEKLYKKSKYTYGVYEKELSLTYTRYLSKFFDFLHGKENFLEIGCGNGFFLLQAKKLGFSNFFGVEPGKEVVAKANPKIKKNIIVDIFKKGQFTKNYFDIICMFQVLDHLPYPNEVLKECYRILKPGGGILCINHDVESFWAKLLGERFPIFDIEHTYLYSKKTLKFIFEKNRFKTIEIFNVANCYPVSYWLKMFPFPNKIKLIIEKLVRLIGISSNRIWVKAGNIGIFAIKPK